LRPELASRSDVRRDLINLLRQENMNAAHPIQAGAELEEYFNYFGDVIGVVASLRDPEAIPVLADAIGTGNLATTALAEFGDRALPTVLAKLGSREPVVRAAALSTSRKMLESGTVTVQERGKLKSIFLGSLGDSDPSVRASA